MHVLSGLYMCVRRRPVEIEHHAHAKPRWEFFTTFDYEWALYRRRMPFKWTMLVRPTHHVRTVFRAPLIFCGLLVHTHILQLYIGARWLTLVFVVCVFILFDRATEMDCDVRRSGFWFAPLQLTLAPRKSLKGGVQAAYSTSVRRRVREHTCRADRRRQATSYSALICTSAMSVLRA